MKRPSPSHQRRSASTAKLGPLFHAVVESTSRSRGLCSPPRMVNRELAPRVALRSDDNVDVGFLGGGIVSRRGGCLTGMLREACPAWLQEVLVVAALTASRRSLTASFGRSAPWRPT